jgi:hypothetical protein
MQLFHVSPIVGAQTTFKHVFVYVLSLIRWVKDVSHEEDAEVHSCVVCPYHGWAFDTAGMLVS